MSGHDPLRWPLLAVLVVLSAAGFGFSDLFGKELLAEIAIFAIFAMSLDLLAGYVGLVSLGHAAFFALGAYTTAACTVFWAWPVSLATLAAVVVAGLVAAVVGSFAVRLSGVFFIMITLAIGQTAYAFFFKNHAFGGDNGMSGTPRFDLSAIGLDADEPAVFAALMLLFAFAVLAFLLMVVRSPFGHLLVAIHQNENRARALGCAVWKYKLAAFVIAGCIAGLSGSLVAQHTGFVSPDLAFWTVSGEVLIMVIVGGMGSILGAAMGAAIIILMRFQISEVTEYWTFYMGLFFVGMVLVASDGIYGRLGLWWRWVWRRCCSKSGAGSDVSR